MAFRDVVVQQTVRVHFDEKMFSEEFMTDFRRYMYDFHDIDSHVAHLAQLHARGIANNSSFIEGYGPAKDIGIKFEVVGQGEEVLEPEMA